MTTEYYQIPSQQGLLPLSSLSPSSPDPWLAAATSALSLNDPWTVKKPSSSLSLFDEDWKNAGVPMHNAGTSSSSSSLSPSKDEKVKVAPKVPAKFHSTSSKLDAWSVIESPSSPQLKRVSPPPADDKPLEDELSGQNRYKTELCKSFTETGACRYGAKCQFAHGKEEVRPILRHPKYKTEICKTFHTTGTCPYGIRCRFIHTRSKEESVMAVKVPSPALPLELEEEDDGDDDVITLKAPPGIPVPQWSKSWNMTVGSPVQTRKTIHRGAERLTQPEPAF